MKTPARILVCLPFVLLLTNCGESFRAQSSISQNIQGDRSQVDIFNDNGFRAPLTSTDRDRQIALSYQSELQGQEHQTLNLTQAIQALDLALVPGSSQDNTGLIGRVHFSCDQIVNFQTQVTPQMLQSQQRLNLTSDSPEVSLRIQCVDSGCNELVVAIRRQSGGLVGTVLVGMAANLQQQNSVTYFSRNVNHRPYFATFHSGAQYRQQNNCPVLMSEDERSVTDRILDVVQEESTQYLVDEARDFLESLF